MRESISERESSEKTHLGVAKIDTSEMERVLQDTGSGKTQNLFPSSERCFEILEILSSYEFEKRRHNMTRSVIWRDKKVF